MIFKWANWCIKCTHNVSSVVEQLFFALVLTVSTLCVYQIICLVCFSIQGLMLIDWTVVQLLCCNTSFLGWTMSMNIVMFHLGQVELLWSQDWTRPGNSYPSNKCFSWDLIMLHCPQANESSSSTKSCFAMDSHSSMIWLMEVIFYDSQEIFNNLVRWSRSIYKE